MVDNIMVQNILKYWVLYGYHEVLKYWVLNSYYLFWSYGHFGSYGSVTLLKIFGLLVLFIRSSGFGLPTPPQRTSPHLICL